MRIKAIMAVTALGLVIGTTAHAQTFNKYGNEDHSRQIDQMILEMWLRRIEQNTRANTQHGGTRTEVVRSTYVGQNKAGQAVYEDGNGKRSVWLGYNAEGQPVFQDQNGENYVAFQGKKPGTEIHIYNN
jgi:hypothetical protein